MNIALLLKSELRRSAGILAGMALIIALALSIAVAAGICERMVKASAAQSADDFDLLIGARGSSSALLLGTVFLRDEMPTIVRPEGVRSPKATGAAQRMLLLAV